MKLPKAYQPDQYESDIYALWEKEDAFRPHGEGKSFSVVFPPPNANGDLHLGHALTNSLQDVAVRYHRLLGDRVLFVPGADHAGFETQVVYEKELAKEGKSRFDFSRDELYERIYSFVADKRQLFNAQLRRLGGSFDWSQFTFTLDEKVVKQAYTTFKKMWDEGLIYRGERLVNFCTFHGTAFADIEVQYKEEKGHLWYISYPLTDGSDTLIVATTRPETMLGDTAVAVHPDDKRYKHLIGKTVTLPITGREVPIVGDEFVEIAFGTGAVKITPAHDPNDFEVAKRHNLPMMTVIDYTGHMGHDAPEAYRGLTVKEARQQIVKDLETSGHLNKTEEYKHSVGHCYKCGTVIEPLLKEQWFVDMEPLAEQAIAVLKEDKIAFFPQTKDEQLVTYLEHLKDWNISRQIAWGIPIPAFQNIDNPDDWIYDEHVDQETIERAGKTYRRDPDVLDTWFSSSSWPYVTLGYPSDDHYLQFYPLSLMDTGGEILYQWVSRMIMLGLYTTGRIPFETVYIHGYVLAADGAKMSKSLGNVVNPIEVIDKYGSDALRMGIIAGRSAGVNRGYDIRKVEDARNFCNKLWNVARYIEEKVGDQFTELSEVEPASLADHWVLTKLQQIKKQLDRDMEQYHFADAYDRIYHFVWDDVADWYIEASKVEPNLPLLAYLLQTTLKIVHPFAPFLTETIWQTLSWQPDTLLAISHFMPIPASSSKKAATFEKLKSIISEIRYLAHTLKLQNPTIQHVQFELVREHSDLLVHLARLGAITEVDGTNGVRISQADGDVTLVVDENTLSRYREELSSQYRDQLALIQQFQNRLNNKEYVANAPKHIVEDTKQQLITAQDKLKLIEQERERFAAQS